jgi:DNA segregation ATPase FtsK/SpoIIIE-like protein
MPLAAKSRLLGSQQTAKRPRRQRQRASGRRGLAVSRPRGREAFGVLLLFVALFLGATLAGWVPGTGLHSGTGPAGTALGRFLLAQLGLSAAALPPLALLLGVRVLRARRSDRRLTVLAGAGFVWAALAGLLHVLDTAGHNALAPAVPLLGGNLGWAVAGSLLGFFRPLGTSLLLLAALCSAATFAFGDELRRAAAAGLRAAGVLRWLEPPLAWVGITVLRVLLGSVNAASAAGRLLLGLGGRLAAGLGAAAREAYARTVRRLGPSGDAEAGDVFWAPPPVRAAQAAAAGSEALALEPPEHHGDLPAPPVVGRPQPLPSPRRPAALGEYDEMDEDEADEDEADDAEALDFLVGETAPISELLREAWAPGALPDGPAGPAGPADALPSPEPQAATAPPVDLAEASGSGLFARVFRRLPAGKADASEAAGGLPGSPPAAEPLAKEPEAQPAIPVSPGIAADVPLPEPEAGTLSVDRTPPPQPPAAVPGVEAARVAEAGEGDLEADPDELELASTSFEDEPVAESIQEMGDPAYAPAGRGYVIPPIELLAEPVPEDHEVLDEELRENSRLLLTKLGDFGVQGAITCIRPGPVITRYELEPAPGIKINKIIGLSEDLALALKAVAPPRVAPIPKSAALGIELPNHHRETVHFKDVVRSDAYRQHPSLLKLALGVDIAGHAYVADLARMPHLLIAGATGSGKSVCINTLLLSLLMNATPEQVQLLLVDPKMLELSIYNDVPHLIEDVVTEPKKAATALGWAVREMEARYKKLSRRKVRSISQYNELVEREPIAAPTRKDPDPPLEYPLPYIVIIIDELADLMMVSGNEVEGAITRLAQMARAAGIHLILATQRPSVDVITGSIKANFPCRISFKVASKVDSRTVLDGNGAEKLLGRGDMFFIAPGTSQAARIHGCFLDEEDIARVVEHWAPQPPMDRRGGSIFAPPIEESAAEDFAAQDELYEQAVRFIVSSGHASISLLQRRLRVGHARAARLIDMMEQEGVVGGFEGSKTREVLWKPEQLPESFGAAGA